MTKGDVSTDGNKAAYQKLVDNQRVGERPGECLSPHKWLSSRVLSSRPTRRDLGMDQLIHDRGG